MIKQNLPFIHLIKTPMNNYVYDVNTNSFIELSDETYAYLEDMQYCGVMNTPASQNVQESIERLQKQGLLSTKRPRKIEHSQSKFLENSLKRNINQMTLQITQECNFRCAYCSYGAKDFQYQREHSPKKMSMETAFKAVDFYVANSVGRDTSTVGFYGGEPLLEFELIKCIVEYAEKKFFGKNLKFPITTNGSLLTPRIAEYLSSHNFSITISLDGTSEIHDRSRKFATTGEGTFATIIKNLEEIKKYYPTLFERILFNVVIDPRYSCNDMHTLFTDNHIFKSSEIMSGIIEDIYSIEKVVPSDTYISEDKHHNLKVYLSLLDRYPHENVSKVAKREIITRYSKLKNDMTIFTELSDVMAPGGPCIPGGQRLFIGVDGDFYPCERVSETSAVMKIGNLNDGFDINKAKDMLNIGQLTEEDCKNCWAIRHCQICVKHCDNNGYLCAEFKRSHCEAIKNQAELQLKDYLLLKDFGVSINSFE
ncbi:MAG: Cys-rich peptide radical SAM maturase CcpM [Oscillospiraceae bacterium]|nr:Cys-rich peptide radical SAM maturase CcpM [Oscillospiraceae bacterium]